MLLDEAQATARMIAAGRKLAGLDLDGLARAAEVSPSTISNVEGGKKRARPENLAAIQRALLMNGVTLMNDNLNGRILLSITYKLPDPIDIFAIAKDE